MRDEPQDFVSRPDKPAEGIRFFCKLLENTAGQPRRQRDLASLHLTEQRQHFVCALALQNIPAPPMLIASNKSLSAAEGVSMTILVSGSSALILRTAGNPSSQSIDIR